MRKNIALVLLPLSLLSLVAVALSQVTWGPGPLEVLSASTYTQGGAGAPGSAFSPMESWVSISFRGPEGIEVERVGVKGVQQDEHSVRSLANGTALVHVRVERRATVAVLVYRWEGRRYSQELPLTDTGEFLYQ